MSHATEGPFTLTGGSADGALMWNGSQWTSLPLHGIDAGPIDTASASSMHVNVSYGGGGGGYPYTSTYWGTNLAITGGSFSRQETGTGVSYLTGTAPPVYGTSYPMAVILPAGEYLSIFTCNNGVSSAGTYADVRQYSTKTDGSDGTFHSHFTRIAGDAYYGALNIARLSFAETRRLYLRGVVFGGATSIPSFSFAQTISHNIVKL